MLNKYPYIIISLLGLILFVPFLGSVHLFDWDEINFAEAAREMIVTNNFSRVQINFEPFWEKPPLFFWLQVLSMKLFGINEFAARMPNAICGILTLNILFFFGKKIKNSEVAWWWVLLYVGSITPHFYFKSGIIDPWYNLFIFLSILHLYQASNTAHSRTRYFLYAGIFLGLALLTKGPVAIIIVGLCSFIYFVLKRFKAYFNFWDLLLFTVSTLIIPLLWFLPDFLKNGSGFIQAFLAYQLELFTSPVASHGQPWYYHPLVLLMGCFPASVFALPYLFRGGLGNTSSFTIWMRILFWAVLILFSMVTTKIVHYSSLCYLPLTFLAAHRLYLTKGLIFNWQKAFLIVIGVMYATLFILIPLVGGNESVKNWALNLINDDFVKANLNFPTPWNGTEWLIGLIFMFLIISLVWSKTFGDNFLKIWLIGNACFLFFTSAVILPKIENHTQGSIISFYKTLKGKDIYLETIGFKSYAHYYYSQKAKPNYNDSLNQAHLKNCAQNGYDTIGPYNSETRGHINGFKNNWYLNAKSDKPIYLVYKIGKTAEIDTNRKFKCVFNQGGFLVYKSTPE